MSIRIPTFNIGQRIVSENGLPTVDFLTAINTAFRSVTSQTNVNSELLKQIADALAQVGIAIGHAEAASATANAVVADQSLINSYVSPDSVLEASSASLTTTITISSHSRVYGDGSTVGVTGGTVTGLEPATVYYVYYVDPGRAGGIVTYIVTVDPTDAAQGSGKHCVGSIQTPSTGSTDPVSGVTTRPPGVPYWKFPATDPFEEV